MGRPTSKLCLRATGKGKRLTPAEKLLIKAEQDTGQSMASVGIKYGVHESTVSRLWSNGKLDVMKNEVQVIKESMADDLYLTAHRSIKQVNDKLDVASASQAAVIMAIAIDKARLLEGQSTENHAHAFLDLINSTPV